MLRQIDWHILLKDYSTYIVLEQQIMGEPIAPATSQRRLRFTH